MEKQPGLGAFSTGVICSTNFDILNEYPAARFLLQLDWLEAAGRTHNIYVQLVYLVYTNM